MDSSPSEGGSPPSHPNLRARAAVSCPKCGAQPGEMCKRPDGRPSLRGRSHWERRMALQAKERGERPIPPHKPGRGGYASGCRCEGCVNANRAYQRAYMKGRYVRGRGCYDWKLCRAGEVLGLVAPCTSTPTQTREGWSICTHHAEMWDLRMGQRMALGMALDNPRGDGPSSSAREGEER